MNEFNEIDILGIPFAKVTTKETLAIMENWLKSDKNHVVATPNPEGVMQAKRNIKFKTALLNADMRLADGIGITLGAKYKGTPLPERVRGVDTTFALFQSLCNKNQSFTVYFLGGKPGVAKNAKKLMEAKYPAMKVAGYHHGFFKENSQEETKILAEINNIMPDILLVCTGMPRAEIWATTHKNLKTKITLCVGGTIDIMGGNVKIAPAFMRKIGLEWLYRLITQPSRFVRMLDIPRFMLAIVK